MKDFIWREGGAKNILNFLTPIGTQIMYSLDISEQSNLCSFIDFNGNEEGDYPGIYESTFSSAKDANGLLVYMCSTNNKWVWNAINKEWMPAHYPLKWENWESHDILKSQSSSIFDSVVQCIADRKGIDFMSALNKFKKAGITEDDLWSGKVENHLGMLGIMIDAIEEVLFKEEKTPD